MDKELQEAVELTTKNLRGLKDFCDELTSRLNNKDTPEAKKRHLVYFSNAINDSMSVILKYNNSLSGKDS